MPYRSNESWWRSIVTLLDVARQAGVTKQPNVIQHLIFCISLDRKISRSKSCRFILHLEHNLPDQFHGNDFHSVFFRPEYALRFDSYPHVVDFFGGLMALND